MTKEQMLRISGRDPSVSDGYRAALEAFRPHRKAPGRKMHNIYRLMKSIGNGKFTQEDLEAVCTDFEFYLDREPVMVMANFNRRLEGAQLPDQLHITMPHRPAPEPFQMVNLRVTHRHLDLVESMRGGATRSRFLQDLLARAIESVAAPGPRTPEEDF